MHWRDLSLYPLPHAFLFTFFYSAPYSTVLHSPPCNPRHTPFSNANNRPERNGSKRNEMNRRTDFERNWNALPEGKVHRPTVGLMKSCPFDRHLHGLPDSPGSHRRHKVTDTVKVYRAIILGIIPVLVLCYGWAASGEQAFAGNRVLRYGWKGIRRHRWRRGGKERQPNTPVSTTHPYRYHFRLNHYCCLAFRHHQLQLRVAYKLDRNCETIIK